MTSFFLGIPDGGERDKTTSPVVAVTVGVLVPLIIILLVVAVIIIAIAIMLRKKKHGKVCHFVFLLSREWLFLF